MILIAKRQNYDTRHTRCLSMSNHTLIVFNVRLLFKSRQRKPIEHRMGIFIYMYSRTSVCPLSFVFWYIIVAALVSSIERENIRWRTMNSNDLPTVIIPQCWMGSSWKRQGANCFSHDTLTSSSLPLLPLASFALNRAFMLWTEYQLQYPFTSFIVHAFLLGDNDFATGVLNQHGSWNKH